MPGRLKVYLGYAAGVGKTYQMLVDARELKRQGKDVVIGYFEPHGRADTIAQTSGLELTTRRRIEYRGAWFEEMDTDAILRRAPQICVVDEFPHTNVPGSERQKRWEDVMALLEHGIDVLTTMNIQHLESLNDQISYITGVRVRETIPDWVMKHADEVVMVDLTPGALLNRLKRGVVYTPDKAERALENFFREPVLVALREMALRQTAHEVDLRHLTPDGSDAGSGPGGDRFPLDCTARTSGCFCTSPAIRRRQHSSGEEGGSPIIFRPTALPLRWSVRRSLSHSRPRNATG